MGITANGLNFYPLFWRHDDCWQYQISLGSGDFTTYNHWGHCHFFMLGYNWGQGNQDAFSGAQTFNFAIQDVWGPRSQDPNQQFQYTVVGTPKWYFTITEVWRRVYIQQWDEDVAIPTGQIVGRRGIKWDASQPSETFGPFREGQGYSPVFIDSARTLPVEYFNSELKLPTQRDNYIKQRYEYANGTTEYPYGDGTLFDPPPNGSTPLLGTPGGLQTYADGLYIYPTLEYQQVVQLNNARLPGYAEKNDISPTQFGDGWDIQLTIPWVNPITKQYQSPFGPKPGVVAPAGQYFNNLVAPASQMTYRSADNSEPAPDGTGGGYDWQNRPFGLKDSQSLQPIVFQDPYGVGDGQWVQQCLGGIIQANAVVTIQSKLGGQTDVTVSSTQYLPQDQFAGTDQGGGSAP